VPSISRYFETSKTYFFSFNACKNYFATILLLFTSELALVTTPILQKLHPVELLFTPKKNKEAIMYARLTFTKTSREHSEIIKKIFNEEVIPVVRTQKGNVGCWLLEPTNDNDDYISLTEWRTHKDADMYEATGTYRMLVEKVKNYYIAKPVLKTYNVTELKMPSTAAQ
jgi:heme-degrading monooxygenase HmoA